MMDRLQEMFDMQDDLQNRLNKAHLCVSELPQTYYTTMTLALVDELMEALRETPWKPWKQHQKLDIDRVKDELVDAWHFLMNLMLWTGMTPKELYDRYMVKNEENLRRQKDGY